MYRQEAQVSEVEENPRNLLLHVLQALPNTCMPQQGGGGGRGRGRESVALLRTTALHLYAWRVAGNPGINDELSPLPSPAAMAAAAVESAASTRAVDERHTEMLLARAVEIEPFHVPTLTALAFVLLQRGSGSGGGGGREMERAERLLERAVEYSGRRGVSSRDLFCRGLCQEAKLVVEAVCFGDCPFLSVFVLCMAPRCPLQDTSEDKRSTENFERRRLFSFDDKRFLLDQA